VLPSIARSVNDGHMLHTMKLQGRWVRFAIRDIRFPAVDDVLRALHANDVVGGRVVDVSDGGADQNMFVVVKLERLEQPVVVPVAKIRDGNRDDI
jgi:hypothetical protein